MLRLSFNEQTAKVISDRIKRRRQAMKMSQAELAKKSGLTPGTVCGIEQGLRASASTSLLKLADVLQVSTDYLLGRKQALDLGDLSQDPKVFNLLKIYSVLPEWDREKVEEYAQLLGTKERPES